MAQGSSGKAERQFLLRSLTRVGPEKPVGYLPLYTLTEFAEADPDRLAADALARGLAAAQFGPAECCIKSGALYIYDRAALDRLLKSNVDTLTAAGMQSIQTCLSLRLPPFGSSPTILHTRSSQKHSASTPNRAEDASWS